MHSEIVPCTNHLAHSKFQVYIDFHSRDQEWKYASTHHESQNIYIPPAKRIDTRSSDSQIIQTTEKEDRENTMNETHQEERDRGGMAEEGVMVVPVLVVVWVGDTAEPTTRSQTTSETHQNGLSIT